MRQNVILRFRTNEQLRVIILVIRQGVVSHLEQGFPHIEINID
jgi:hypothetical protein